MLNTILVAYDGSDHADNALALACDVAKTYKASLHIAHTPQHDSPPIVFGAAVSGLGEPVDHDKIREAGIKIGHMAREKAKEHGVDVAEVHVEEAQPADYILRTADEIDADLIVLGRRGLGSVKALALGSVSQAVAHGATCACMTVV